MNSPLNRDADLYLADVLSDEVMTTPAGDLLAEVAEDLGDRRALAKEFDRAFARAVRQTRARRVAGRLRDFAAQALALPSWRPLAATVAALVVVVAVGALCVEYLDLSRGDKPGKVVASADPYSPPTADAPAPGTRKDGCSASSNSASKCPPRPDQKTDAHSLLVREAEKGNPQAMTSLGSLHRTGDGVPRDYAKARSWYEKAAEKGEPAAMAALGFLYLHGKGVPRDYAEAKSWYEKAAEKGEPGAMSALGFLYLHGGGLPHYTKAARWYRQAVEAGYPAAMTGVEIVAHECGAAAVAGPADPRTLPSDSDFMVKPTSIETREDRERELFALDEANPVKTGSCVTVYVRSGVAGHLVLFNLNAERKSALILGKSSPIRVGAGEFVTLPRSAENVQFRVAAPLGRNEIIAVILPEAADLEKAAKAFEGAGSFDTFADVLASIAETTASQTDISSWVPRAIGTRRFEVVGASSGSSYVAVVSTQKSRMDALRAFADLTEKHPELLSDKLPDVQEANLGEKGIWYRAVVGPPGSREAAMRLCSQLKAVGQECWVTEY